MSSSAPAARKGLSISRRFTTAGASPLDQFTFAKRDAVITNPDGSVVFEMRGVEVPQDWDQVAVDVLASKYFRKAGVPQTDADGNPIVDSDDNPVLGRETSAKQWAMRLANAWMIWGRKGGYFAKKRDAEAFRDEVAYMLLAQMASPNSPQHFNTGLFEAYGILNSPNGEWYFDAESGTTKLSTHRYERSSANACFIQSISDELVGDGSIFDLMEREARLFQAGSGSGTNFSPVRGKGEKLSGGGTASGAISFIKVSDAAAGAIKSGGTTRRAAKMILLDVDHPEIFEFIWAKAKEEQKAKALVQAGWDPAWNAEDGAYANCHYQNFNGSIMANHGFMQAVIDDAEWHLRARTTGETIRVVRARDLWDAVAQAAWECADPGVMFSDIINDWNTVANDEPIVATNPCAEYVFVNDTACNLASINLVTFFDGDAQVFDFDAFEHATRLWTLVLEITVSMSHYPSAVIAERSYEYRTLGLGYCNLGSLLMRAGLAYDSEEGRAAMAAITATMTNTAYAFSAEMAGAVGACVAWDRNVEPASRVLRNHARATYGNRIDESDLGAYEQLTVNYAGLDHVALAATAFAAGSAHALRAADRMLELANEHGIRNMQVVVIAPTGTIGLQMSADTTGVEPPFALVVGKKLAGGGYMKIVDESVAPALRALGYDEADVKAIRDYAVGTGTLVGETAVNSLSLAAKGVPAAKIDELEAALPAAFDLPFAATKVGLDLEAAGFTAEEIASSSLVICGHQTVEGAPELRPEHLPVFDCANYCGDGTRSIHWQGHVKALGAVAPFVSGSISKTINMPNDATVDDIKDAYQLTYDLGVKNCAIYRDNSKGSQVLSSGTVSEVEAEVEEVAAAADGIVAEAVRIVAGDIPKGISPTAYYDGHNPPRFKLPSMRMGPTWELKVADAKLFLRTGEYEDGTLGEVFLDWSREGSTLRGLTSCLSIAISQGLQHGVPLSKFVDTFLFQTFEPRGMSHGHDAVRLSMSVVDMVFRILAFEYLGREDVVQVKGMEPMRYKWAGGRAVSAPAAAAPAEVAAAEEPAAVVEPAAKQKNEPGPPCSTCGNATVRSGACFRCLSCGDSSGCS